MDTSLHTACRAVLAGMLSVAALAEAGGIDHRVGYDNSGIWSHNIQIAITDTLVVGEIAAGVWYGSEDRFGRTMWQSIDSSVVSGVAVQAGKYIFTRSRPSQTDNPSQWFQGKGNYSFPSGEVTAVTSIVTPVMLEYGHDYPAVYALAAIPVYTSVARVKEWGHWQTDVIASLALGGLSGYWAHSRESPLIVGVLPHAVSIGVRAQF